MKLSIVIVSYNTKRLTLNCIKSILDTVKDVSYEIILVDNDSTDKSVEAVRKFAKSKDPLKNNLKIIENKKNLGFAKANNQAKSFARGEYILFLNSDTIVHENTINESLEYLDSHKRVAALTCKIVLPDGKLDKDVRRSFITPWIGFTHIFLRLDRLFPESKLFAKYWYGYIPEDKTHEVDVLQGAYFLVRKKVLDEVGWFDEDYFLDGEDVDLCWRIKQAGWKIVYFPKVKITHFKGSSKGKVESIRRKKIPLKKKLRFRMAGVDSMEIFVRKRLWDSYPLAFNLFMLAGIKLLKLIRFLRTVLLG
ncbi:MAG: glycosyltransferase family 2 protein [Candidatus Woesebacteria bacterium]|jgi:hypothetical protein